MTRPLLTRAGETLGTLEEREKAHLRPIIGAYPEYAREVRRLLGYDADGGRPYLSLRMAEGKTGVKHTTIGTMARGFRADAYNTRRFALGLRGDPDHLLNLGGYIVPTQAHDHSDPLSRIGPDVDISTLSQTPLSPLRASAGDARFPGDATFETESLASVLPEGTRSIRVVGSCMEPLYRDGDILLVREKASAENGQEVIALLDDDSLACKVYRANGEVYLQPTNGEARIPVGRFRIVGVVEGLVRLRR